MYALKYKFIIINIYLKFCLSKYYLKQHWFLKNTLNIQP